MEEKAFDLKTERLGPLPIINHFTGRLGLVDLLESAVPTEDPRCTLSYASRLGVLLRSIITEREPIYRMGEVVSTYAPEGFGLEREEAAKITDDMVGRALDRLFDADRGSLLTEIVISAGERFSLCLKELHNDSTTIKFAGQYARAKGRSIRGKKAPYITYGHSKDRRPDLKQLMFILTSTKDGGVPVQFRCEAGNESDSRTHEETWDALCRITGRCDFLYVADSKLCNEDALEYIDGHGGRLVTVLPRNRSEDGLFRKWIQNHEPAWEKVADRENPQGKGGLRDRWFVALFHMPSIEGWPVIWVLSSLLRLKQAKKRTDRIAKAEEELDDLARRERGPRARRRSRYDVQKEIDEILKKSHVVRYIKVSLDTVPEHTFKQEKRGRPGPDTTYVRKTKLKWKITWSQDEEAIIRPEERRHVPPSHQRQVAQAETGPRGAQAPARNREALLPGEERPCDSSGAPQERGARRGAVLPLLHRPARELTHREGDAKRNGEGGHQGYPSLPGGACQPPAYFRADTESFQPGREAHTAR